MSVSFLPLLLLSFSWLFLFPLSCSFSLSSSGISLFVILLFCLLFKSTLSNSSPLWRRGKICEMEVKTEKLRWRKTRGVEMQWDVFYFPVIYKKKKNPHSCVLLEINYIIWIRWTVGRNRGISGSRKTLNLKNTLGLSIYLCHLLSVWLTEHSSSFPNLNFLTSKVEMLLSNGDELKFGHQDFWSLVIDPWICYFPWQKGLCRCT